MMWDTTALYIELLVIGFEVSLWLLLFVASLTGRDWISDLCTNLDTYPTVLAIGVILVVAYLLGIVFDKVAHLLIGAHRTPLRKWLEDVTVEKRWDLDSRWIYAQLMVHEQRAIPDVLYARSKVRILRASVLNVPLIALAGVTYLLRQNSEWWWLALATGLGLWALVCFAYVYTQRLYRRRLLRFQAYLPKDSPGDGLGSDG